MHFSKITLEHQHNLNDDRLAHFQFYPRHVSFSLCTTGRSKLKDGRRVRELKQLSTYYRDIVLVQTMMQKKIQCQKKENI